MLRFVTTVALAATAWGGFTCETDCVTCTEREVLGDGTQRVTVDATSCKGDCLSWMCARNPGATLEACLGSCAGQNSEGTKCESSTGGTYILPAGDTTLVLQVHDGQQTGGLFCTKANKDDCCGGCGQQGCCNHVVELSTCPTMPPPSPPCTACGTNAATVKTIAPDGMTVAHDAPPRFPLENFMDAWTSCDEQIYIYDCLPPAPTRGFFPEQNHGIPEDSTLEITCPCNADDSPCEVIVSQYHCPGCSTSTNGGFPTVLPPLGWRAGSCAPFMSTTQSWDTAEQWRMLAFRKLVAAGTTEQIPVTGSPAEHVAVFVRQCAIDCATVDPMAGVPDECVCTGMEIGDCHSAWCPPRTGPPVIAPVPCAMDPRCAPTCALAMMP